MSNDYLKVSQKNLAAELFFVCLINGAQNLIPPKNLKSNKKQYLLHTFSSALTY